MKTCGLEVEMLILSQVTQCLDIIRSIHHRIGASQKLGKHYLIITG